MKKILITGATGFIGRYVISYLLQEKYAKKFSVVATSANEEKAKEMIWFSRIKYIPFDLREMDLSQDYFTFFDSPDLLIHLAWEGLPNYKAPFHVHENLPCHFRFLKNLIANGLNDLTIAGTCLEYGMQEGMLGEDKACFPAISYAKAKDELRKLLEALQAEFDFSMKWARLFYMYGAGQNPNSLFSQLDKALGEGQQSFNMSGGEQVRDYLPVEKMGEYIVQTALQKNVSGIINCCSGNPVTVKQLVENYLKEKNKTINLELGYYPYLDYEPMCFWGDNSKLKTIIKNE